MKRVGELFLIHFIMKNNLITPVVSFFLCCLLCTGLVAQEQTLPIGTLKNGTASLTEQANAQRLLLANLPAGVTLSELKLEFSEYDNAYYLTASVGNNDISSVGIKLYANGGTIEGRIGPGVEITCTGYECNNCRLSLSKWKPYCKCSDPNPGPEYRCDMSSKVTISL